MLSSLLRQITPNCITEMTCWPENPIDVFSFFNIVYGIPNAATLGLFLGMIIGAIYVHTRSLAHLAVLGIYTASIVSATWLSDAYVAEQYRVILYVIALAIGTLVIIFVLKVLRE